MSIEIEEMWARRQTGRSTWLLKKAALYASLGQSVLYVAPNLDRVKWAQDKVIAWDLLPNDGGGTMQFESQTTINSQRGLWFDLVILDDAECYEERVSEILCFARNRAIIMRRIEDGIAI